jgi:hypothetical protein
LKVDNDPYLNGPLAAWLLSAVPGGHRDPWPPEFDQAVKDPKAVPLCINCLFPQGPDGWFCPHCGYPTGDYVAMMPYLQIFVVGELFRQGVMGPPVRHGGVQLFLVVFSLSQYGFFAPIYWYWMVRRAGGKPICQRLPTDFEMEFPD